jgi:predicted aldo/keto reductase-like oxidoreductase
VKYRQFGTLDWEVSALGFGAMRLPTIGGDREQIDAAKAGAMLRYAFDHGVNYVDTGYPYHDGRSESFVGGILNDGYRDTVRVATKMPIWQVDARADLDRIFTEQLAKLQTDHVDFYLFHGLREERWARMRELDALQWAETQVEEGRIGHLGFSFHDRFDVFKRIVDGYEGWTLCQVQYNYVDQDYQAGIRGVRYARAKGLAVVAMEPIQGGNLAVNPPPAIRAIWEETPVPRTPAEWALHWVWNQPEVTVALSGMSTLEQVAQNVRSAAASGPDTLTRAELQLIARVRDRYREYGFIGCTRCGYCQPCPQGVDIPENLAFSNAYYTVRGDDAAQDAVKARYATTIPCAARAAQCVQCGECEAKCPQQLPIPRLLTRTARRFVR